MQHKDQRAPRPLLMPAADGLLDEGLHGCDLDAVRERFVEHAPGTAHREQIWRAFLLWLDQLRGKIPVQRLWIDGSFVTYVTASPEDIDVVAWIDGAALDALSEQECFFLRDLFTQQTADWRRQPMGGLVDAGFARTEIPERRAYWQDLFSRRSKLDSVTRTRKGFMEVVL